MTVKFEGVFLGAEKKVSKKSGNIYFIVKMNDDEGQVLEIFTEKEHPMVQYKPYQCVAKLKKAYDKLNISLLEAKAI